MPLLLFTIVVKIIGELLRKFLICSSWWFYPTFWTGRSGL